MVRSVAKEFVKKPIVDHPPTRNDREIAEAEAKMDRVEAAVALLHREEREGDYSPVVAAVKEERLLENFR